MTKNLALDRLLEAWAEDKRLTPAEARGIGEAAVGHVSQETGEFSVDWWRKVFQRASVALNQTNDFRRYLSNSSAL